MKSTIAFLTLVGSAGLIAAPVQAENFHGPYAGVQAGWTRAEADTRTIDAQPLDAQASRDALLIGGYVGYNYRLDDNFVLGAEAAFNGAVDDDFSAQSAGDVISVDPRYSFDLTARAGYVVNDKTLLYVRGGYANARLRTTLQSNGTQTRASENLDGWIAGGGAERLVVKNFSARLEYRYSDLGNNGGQYDQHQVLAGVSYNF